MIVVIVYRVLDWIFDIYHIKWEDALIVALIGLMTTLGGVGVFYATKDIDFSQVTQIVGPVVELFVEVFGDGGYFYAAIGGAVGLSEQIITRGIA